MLLAADQLLPCRHSLKQAGSVALHDFKILSVTDILLLNLRCFHDIDNPCFLGFET